MIQDAASGDEERRREFVLLYGRAIRAYLDARWKARTANELDDAVQEVYLECLRHGGVLERAAANPPKSFRPFLLGVVRNVARRFEQRAGLVHEVQPTTGFVRAGGVDDDADPARLFDQQWATGVVRRARQRVEERLMRGSEAARRRAELLRLRYQDGLPVREIAKRLDEDPRRLHHQLEVARREFREVLREIVAFDLPGTASEVEQECRLLLSLLGESGANA